MAESAIGKILLGDLVGIRQGPLRYFLNLQDKGDVVPLRFGPFGRGYFLNDPELIREVLVTKQSAFHKGRGLEKAKGLIGEGLLTSEDETHRRQRQMIQPYFTPHHIKRYAEEMVQDTLFLLESWQEGEERAVNVDMMTVTLNVITRTMFGTQVGDNLEHLREAIEFLLKRVIEETQSLLGLSFLLPTKRNQKKQKSRELLNREIYSIIEQRKREGGEHHDLLSVLLAASDEAGGNLTEQELRDQVMTIFLAGHETTAHTLSWTWYLLAQHSEVDEKFHAELKEVLGDRPPTHEDVRRLTYTSHIIEESMRLYPAAWTVTRKAMEEVQIGEQKILPGEQVFCCQYVMHRNPKYFDDPYVFRPERFAGDLLKRIPQFAYFPFGGGPRVCIGNHFAMMEAVLILATIGQKYRMELAAGHPVVEPEPLITLRPKQNIHMILHKR